jgi:hypothetical protein
MGPTFSITAQPEELRFMSPQTVADALHEPQTCATGLELQEVVKPVNLDELVVTAR